MVCIVALVLAPLGCAKRDFTLWSSDLPTIDPPTEPAEIPDEIEGEAPRRAEMLIGQRTPYTDENGIATHAAVILPVTTSLRVYNAAATSPEWEGIARDLLIGWHEDRAWADQAVQPVVEERDAYAHELRLRRALEPVVAVALIIGGVALGVGAVELTDRLLETP
jgi:hypothetical protein